MSLYRDEGVVLRSIKLGEADRIVTIFSAGHGKVRAVAKGVRKTTSRFGGRLEPPRHVALQLYRGRGELDTVTQVETLDAWRPLREHFGNLTHALSMVEAVDQVTLEREPNIPLYRMLVGALDTLSTDPAPMVAPAFFWKLLSLEGFHPVLDACARCGSDTEPLVGFAFGEGGAVCAGCRSAGGWRVQPATLAVLRRCFDGGLRSVLAEPPGPVADELEHLAVAALEYHLERRLRSAHILV